MSDPGQHTEAFQTLAQLEDAYYDLLAQFDALTTAAQAAGPQSTEAQAADPQPTGADTRDIERGVLIGMADGVQVFLRRGEQAGAYLHEPDERQSAQAKLDYWSNLFYSSGVDQPRSMLVPHDPASIPRLSNDLCPYRGLDPFSEKHAAQFFGRADQVAALVKRLRAGERLIVVTGRSGSGKSSLVFAGLLPELAGYAIEDSRRLRIVPPLVPGVSPLQNLVDALQSVCPRLLVEAEREAELQRLRKDPSRILALLSEDGSSDPALLVVDQFEEAMTQRSSGSAADFDAFVAAILQLTDVPEPRHRLVLTMRRDVEPKLAAIYPELNGRYARGASFAVSAMDQRQLQDAIVRPAEAIGLRFQDGVVEELVASMVGEDAGLPLLQFTLMALWDARPGQGNLIMRDTLRTVGSPREAMAGAAQRLYERFPTLDLQEATRKMMLELAGSDGATVFRNRVTRAHLRAAVGEHNCDIVVERFARARLLRIIGDADRPASTDLVEVAHEALLRNWPLLDQWMRERRHQRDRRTLLRKHAEEWQSASTSDKSAADYLLTGLALQQAEAEFAGEALPALEREFLATSRLAEKKREERLLAQAEARRALEREQAALKSSKQNALVIGAVWVAVVALATAVVGAGGWVWSQRELRSAKEEVKSNQEKAKAIWKRAEAIQKDADEIQRSAREELANAKLVAEAVVKTARKEAETSRRQAEQTKSDLEKEKKDAKRERDTLSKARDRFEAQAHLREAMLLEPTDAERAVQLAVKAVDKDPRQIVATGQTLIRALRYHRPSSILPADKVGSLKALALSPDGKFLLTASDEGVKEWRMDTALSQQPWAWTWPPGNFVAAVYAVAYSPNNRDFAVSTDEGVWLRQGDEPPKRLTDEDDVVRMRFNADGQLLAATDREGQVFLWNVADTKQWLKHRPFAPPVPPAAREPGNLAFVDSLKGPVLVVIDAARANGQELRQQFATYALQKDGASQSPEVALLPACARTNIVAAAGGQVVGYFQRRRPCMHRLADVLANKPEELNLLPTLPANEEIEHIAFSAEGRHVVALMRRSGEARLIDLREGRYSTLQGAFDLRKSASFEPVLSVSANGLGVAIAAENGSVRIFDLSARRHSLPDRADTIWVSPDEQYRWSRRVVAGRDTFELQRMGNDERIRSIPAQLLPELSELPEIALTDSGRKMTFVGKCRESMQWRRDDRCIASIDLEKADADVAIRRLGPPLSGIFRIRNWSAAHSAGDLFVVEENEKWRIVKATLPRDVLELPAEKQSMLQRFRNPTGPVALGNERLFAVRRPSADGTRIEIYDVSDAGATLRSAIDLDGPPSGVRQRFEHDGRFLIIQHRNSVSIRDLQKAPDSRSVSLPEGTRFETVRIDTAGGTIAIQQRNEPWRILRLEDASQLTTLPTGFAVMGKGGRYSWGEVSPGRWKLRAVARPATDLLSVEGKSPNLKFSEDGNAVAIVLKDENTFLLHRLPSGQKVLDATYKNLPLRSGGDWLTGRGNWLWDDEGRVYPSDPGQLLEIARKRAPQQ